jgi:RHS repeat-associated protein
MSFLRRDNGLNQYTSWENNDPNPPGHWGTAMSYDDNSPWAPHTAPPGNGVMMAEGNLVASYNALNQPVAMIPTGSPNIYWFGYDPLGRCVKRVVGPSAESGTATYFYYDGGNLIQEGPSATAIDRIYMLGNRVDEIVADYAATNGQWIFHHSEGRGHNMLLTAANGTLAEQNEYDAFGRPYFFSSTAQPLNSSTFGNRFLFTGREYLSELKLYDYRARMYQPEIGRFMQPDPQHFAAGDYNLYRYCHNDPVNRSDPTGMAERILEDFRWKSACFFDGGNSFQGSYTEFMNRSSVNSARDMAAVAENKSSSNKYRNTKNEKGEDVYHCNLLPADAAEESGRLRPQVHYTNDGFLGFLKHLFKRDASSHELASNIKIRGWSDPRPVSEAARGDIIAQQHGEWGHCGVVVAPGSTMSVNTDAGGVVQKNSWGFRPFGQNHEGPGDPPPVVRHYIGEQQQ